MSHASTNTVMVRMSSSKQVFMLIYWQMHSLPLWDIHGILSTKFWRHNLFSYLPHDSVRCQILTCEHYDWKDKGYVHVICNIFIFPNLKQTAHCALSLSNSMTYLLLATVFIVANHSNVVKIAYILQQMLWCFHLGRGLGCGWVWGREYSWERNINVSMSFILFCPMSH